MQKRIIIDKSYGRLGNALYRLANVVAFAMENEIIVWDRSMLRSGYSKLFPRIDNRLFLRYPTSSIVPFSCHHLHRVQSRMIWIAGQKTKFHMSATNNVGIQYILNKSDLFGPGCSTVVLRGFHYNADECVTRQATYLRWLFAPRNEVAKSAEKLVSQLIQDGSHLVGVHIRRGDFKSWHEGKYYFELYYYRQAMEQTIKAYSEKKVIFAILSDSDELDLSSFSGLPYIQITEPSDDSFDWVFMSMCDCIIAPLYSTYSGWASFFGETPIFRLNGRDLPETPADFCFHPILNNSREHNIALETTSLDSKQPRTIS